MRDRTPSPPRRPDVPDRGYCTRPRIATDARRLSSVHLRSLISALPRRGPAGRGLLRATPHSRQRRPRHRFRGRPVPAAHAERRGTPDAGFGVHADRPPAPAPAPPRPRLPAPPAPARLPPRNRPSRSRPTPRTASATPRSHRADLRRRHVPVHVRDQGLVPRVRPAGAQAHRGQPPARHDLRERALREGLSGPDRRAGQAAGHRDRQPHLGPRRLDGCNNTTPSRRR